MNLFDASNIRKLLNSAKVAFMFGALVFFGLQLPQQAEARNFPLCDNPTVEARIFKTYRWAERKTWQRGLDMISLSRVHEHRTTQYDGSTVARRYCMAHAHFSDGSKRPLYFMINNKGGFAGFSWNVTQCIAGLDPWKNHDGNCRAIR